MNDRHFELLQALYNVEVIPPVQASSRKRFELERSRRILDICRIIWKNWPSAVLYARAWYGDAMVFETASSTMKYRFDSANFDAAVEAAFEAWIVRKKDKLLRALRCYDDARKGRWSGAREPTTEEREYLERLLPEGYRLFDFQFDIIQFVRGLELLGKMKAPDRMIQEHMPSEGAITLAFYSKNRTVYALQVGETEQAWQEKVE